MSRLLYMIASLPSLTFDAPPPIGAAEFIELCRENLPAGLASAAVALVEGGECSHAWAAEWKRVETLLRNAVVRQRAVRRGSEAAGYYREAEGVDLRIERGVEGAFQSGDPLQRERALDLLRWQLIEELQGLDPLGQRVILGYALKLKMILKWAERTAEAGDAAAAELTDISVNLNQEPQSVRA